MKFGQKTSIIVLYWTFIEESENFLLRGDDFPPDRHFVFLRGLRVTGRQVRG